MQYYLLFKFRKLFLDYNFIYNNLIIIDIQKTPPPQKGSLNSFKRQKLFVNT